MELVFDTEGNGLRDNITKLWCICTIDVDTEEERQFGPDELNEGLDYLFSADKLICHNLIGFDLVAIKKLFDREYTGEVEDTLVLSCLLNPDRVGGHSVEAWAKRLELEEQKVQNDVWNVYHPTILERCISDTRIQLEIYKSLLKEMEE